MPTGRTADHHKLTRLSACGRADNLLMRLTPTLDSLTQRTGIGSRESNSLQDQDRRCWAIEASRQLEPRTGRFMATQERKRMFVEQDQI